MAVLVLGALTLLALATSAQGAGLPTRMTTAASASVPVGGAVSDTALLTGAFKPKGTITFALYGATDPKCAGAPVFTATVPVAVPAMSGAYTPTRAGTYSFIATYSGDAVNAKSSGKCGDPGETVAVTPLTPTVTTVASPSVALGGSITDTAVLTGGLNPTGTVTFNLYGAGDPTCAGTPVFTSTVAVTATPAVSAAYRPTVAGTYRYVATYSGDGANTPASTGCADVTEAVAVTGSSQTTPPPPAAGCDAAGMAHKLVDSVVAVLTRTPGGSFKATCSAGVRIVLRAKEIRPGNPGFPRRDGFTTMANTLTHSSNGGQIAFTLNSQGIALRNYAGRTAASLIVFAIVHVRPDRSFQSSEAIQIFNLR